jgi:hypothetical protein
MFEDFDTYEFYENDLEEMGRNESWEDAQGEMADIYDADNLEDFPYDDFEDQHLDTYFENQYDYWE